MKFPWLVPLAFVASTASAGIDLVFKIDESGSMRNEQVAVQNAANAIFAGLPAGSHGAVVGYGSGRRSGQVPFVHQSMTPDPATFAAGVAQLVASGSLEQGWRATYEVATDTVLGGPLNYTGDPVCQVIISDERLDQGGRTRQEAIDAMVANGHVFFAVVPGGSIATDAQAAAAATGGTVFDLGAFQSNPTPVLEAVVAACVEAVLPVALDIKPTSCPNPVNLKQNGVIPVALLGSDEFDASWIDPDSLRLNGECAAIRSELEDVAGPFEGERSDPISELDCTTDGPDGYVDLTAKFEAQCAAGTTDLTERGPEIWTVTGEYTDGDGNTREFSTDDVVRIMP